MAFDPLAPVTNDNPIPVQVVSGGGGGGSTIDKEFVVTTYRAKNAFTGASVGDTITATQVYDLTGTNPVLTNTIWFNQSTALALASAPAAANLEIVGASALTDAQLRATPINVNNGLAQPLTDTQLRASAVAISNTSITNLDVDLGAQADAAATSDTGTFSLISLFKRALQNWTSLLSRIPTLGQKTSANSYPVVIASDQTVSVSASALPLPTGAATETTLAALNTKTPALGAAAPGSSSPVTLPNDVTVGAAASIAALNIDLLTGNASGWYDAANFHSVAIQVIGGAGISAGAIFFEQTNDITNAAAGNVWPVEEVTTLTPTPNIAAITIAASTIRMFTGQVMARYVRVRVSTAFAGGTVQAVAVFSQMPYNRMVQTVHQATAANLNFTLAALPALVAGVANIGYVGLQLPLSVADVASAALTTTTTTAAFTPAFGVSYEVNIPVTAVTGTTPTLDVSIEESDDGGTNWFKVYDFPRITATGMYRSPKLPLTGNRVRYVQTVGGTTPSFTRAVNRLQSSDRVDYIRQLVDRTIVLTTLNSTTVSINAQNCKNVQLAINIGAATTPPSIQLQGSDDGGASWYNIGTALAAVASSTVQQVVTNVNAQLLRALVSSAGTGVTAGYVQVKAY